ncbi:hypothetical protein [Nonomuraea dietziae]|uniref:hypothetical protein n=1 Tax=Nonomuraea dietziae TaxID=65515 RepID=UPI0031E27646
MRGAGVLLGCTASRHAHPVVTADRLPGRRSSGATLTHRHVVREEVHAERRPRFVRAADCPPRPPRLVRPLAPSAQDLLPGSP